MQHEITKVGPLLDKNGNLNEPGYAKKLLPIYNRENVKGGALRLKEWDYYYFGNEQYGVCMTIADNSYFALDSISFLDFNDEPWENTKSITRWFTMGKTNLPLTSTSGVTEIVGKDYWIKFEVKNNKRYLTGYMKDFKDGQAIDIDVELLHEPEESVVVCTPFDKEAHFYYNQKINCMRAKGTVKLGDKKYVFDPESSFGLLDWGRGVWTRHNIWYWGSASGLLNGVDFGFNIGYGFGNTRAASENMLFYNGKAHKLSEVTIDIPKKDDTYDYLAPWTITSDDGRFEMEFVPILNRSAFTDVKFIVSDQNQVFGHFTGTVVLDDGSKLEVKNLFGFTERVENKW